MYAEYYQNKWDEIHRNAAKVVWGEWSHRRFNDWIRELPYELPCKICRNHALDYMETNPPEYANDPFVWSWEFHNAVNARIGKPFYDYYKAAERYGV